MSKFTISAGFTDAERNDVARLYWQAFSAKLGKILGPDARAFTLFAQIISPEFALIAHHPVGAAIGVKTALLHAIKDQAKVLGLRHVQLDVIDINPRAQALYLREGFVPGQVEDIGPLRWIFGFAKSTRMTWTA